MDDVPNSEGRDLRRVQVGTLPSKPWPGRARQGFEPCAARPFGIPGSQSEAAAIRAAVARRVASSLFPLSA